MNDTSKRLGYWVPVLLLLCLLNARGEPPAGYYDSAQGKVGDALRTALHDIIDDHQSIPYSSSLPDSSDALRVLDADPDNPEHVILVYSRRSEPASTFPDWNREHLWPNSLGIDSVLPSHSDLHNLRAADANVNSARGNLFYDVTSVADGSVRIPGHQEAPESSKDANSWEPPDEIKGDIARAMFYMDVRYSGDKANEPDLILTDDLDRISTSASFMGSLSTLLQWHHQDPVDGGERLRNDRVEQLYQGNRNPFVDHPEYVGRIFQLLEYSVEEGRLVLRWPVHLSGAQLQAADTVAGPWSSVMGSPTEAGAFWEWSPTGETEVQFYRLLVE